MMNLLRICIKYPLGLGVINDESASNLHKVPFRVRGD